MKSTARGRQSSARRKVVISDDPNQKSKQSNATLRGSKQGSQAGTAQDLKAELGASQASIPAAQ